MPPFLKGKGEGWVTAEYGMLPRATSTRSQREVDEGRALGPHPRDPAPDRALAARGGGHEARSASAPLWVDCDVLQADGGTRTASITGAFVALVDGAAP